jgi:hypothetical protein
MKVELRRVFTRSTLAELEDKKQERAHRRKAASHGRKGRMTDHVSHDRRDQDRKKQLEPIVSVKSNVMSSGCGFNVRHVVCEMTRGRKLRADMNASGNYNDGSDDSDDSDKEILDDGYRKSIDIDAEDDADGQNDARTYDRVSMKITVKASRVWQSYFWRVNVVMILISVQASLVFLIGDGTADQIIDRLGYGVTLFVAAVTYQSVISESLPKLSYMTELDKFVMTVFCFITALMVFNGCLPYIIPDDPFTPSNETATGQSAAGAAEGASGGGGGGGGGSSGDTTHGSRHGRERILYIGGAMGQNGGEGSHEMYV